MTTAQDWVHLLGKIDFVKIAKFAKRVDLGELLETLNKLEPSDIQKISASLKKTQKPKMIPAPNGDFYNMQSFLDTEELSLVTKVREFMLKEVAPIANEYWAKAEFPMHLIPKFAQLGIGGLVYKGYSCPGKRFVLEGLIVQEIARTDVSISTFFGVQSGLAMGSIYVCGSEEQKQKYLPKMQNFEIIGAFGLTEPEVGSAVAGGLTTTCKREGDTWTLNGQKKWIGNATFSDITIIWARDVDTDQVKGFIVKKDNPGFKAEKIEHKISLRIVQNALITLTNCKVKEEDRLQNANSFKNTAEVLRMTRAGVAWQAVGCARGAYENALSYAQKRKQFGRAITGFQLIQDLFSHMLAKLTAMQTMVMRLSEIQDEGKLLDEHASLAKVFCTVGCREITSLARESVGGNGILMEENVARFIADAEALYSYEGTKQINSLIVGRAITGLSAFI